MLFLAMNCWFFFPQFKSDVPKNCKRKANTNSHILLERKWIRKNILSKRVQQLNSSTEGETFETREEWERFLFIYF